MTLFGAGDAPVIAFQEILSVNGPPTAALLFISTSAVHAPAVCTGNVNTLLPLLSVVPVDIAAVCPAGSLMKIEISIFGYPRPKLFVTAEFIFWLGFLRNVDCRFCRVGLIVKSGRVGQLD